MNYPFLVKFQSIIDETDALSDISKASYKARLKTLTDITNHDVDWILKNCTKTMAMIKGKNVTEPQTIRSYINAILACFKHSNLQTTHKKAYQCWAGVRKKISAIAQEKYEQLKASPRQIEGYVAWQDILETRDKLGKDTDEYLLLSLYTMIPPSRADFNNVKIYNKEPTNLQKENHDNYLVVQGNTMKLVFQEFKTKSKLHTYENLLPPDLVKVIQHSLKVKPRQYLVVSPRSGEPYIKSHSFTVYFDRLLHKLFNKPVTINTLRHSYVNHLDFNTMLPAEKTHIARLMMHSVSTMDRYRLVIPAKGTQDHKEKVCTVTCKDKEH